MISSKESAEEREITSLELIREPCIFPDNFHENPQERKPWCLDCTNCLYTWPLTLESSENHCPWPTPLGTRSRERSEGVSTWGHGVLKEASWRLLEERIEISTSRENPWTHKPFWRNRSNGLPNLPQTPPNTRVCVSSLQWEELHHHHRAFPS